MCQPLPVGNYKLFISDELNYFDVRTLNDNEGFGYFMECDIEIPEELHDYFRELLPLAEKVRITSNQISTYQQNSSTRFKQGYVGSDINKQKKLGNLFPQFTVFIVIGIKSN